MLEQHEREIQDALFKDLGKPGLEAFAAEIAFTAERVQGAAEEAAEPDQA